MYSPGTPEWDGLIAEIYAKSDEALVEDTGYRAQWATGNSYHQPEPKGFMAHAELTRRNTDALNLLASESKRSGDWLLRWTIALVVLTIALVGLTVALLVKG